MPRRYWLSLIIFCLLAAVSAGLVYGYLLGFSKPVSDEPVIYGWMVVLAASLGAALFWWLLVLHPQKMIWQRGFVAGLLTALLAYPLAFMISGYISLLRFGPGDGGWLQSALLLPVLSLFFSLFGWWLTGWFTLPVGALFGALIARLFRDRPVM